MSLRDLVEMRAEHGLSVAHTTIMRRVQRYPPESGNAAFYVSEYTELAHAMLPRQALREASRNRLRPITMTTLAAILTLLPLGLAIGQGSAIQQPLAIATIAGLLLQYPLELLVMPVLIGLTIRRSAP
jgi:multidrug efflux pump subunit AcrB